MHRRLQPHRQSAARYVGRVADPEIDDLLDGLEGTARAERAELIDWLLEQGVTAEEIRSSASPTFLASRRLIGDDGTYVSAREVAAAAGVDLEQLQRIQRAVGLPWMDDPDAHVQMRADGAIAEHSRRFIEAGIDPQQAIQTLRVLADGLSHTADLMRSTVVAAIAEPGITELEIAKRSRDMVAGLAPLLGPFVQDMLMMQLRHQLDIDEVTEGERRAGAPVPGARQVAVAFADLVGFTRLGEMVPPEELVQLAERLTVLGHDIAVPPVRFIKTIGDAVMFVSPEPAPLVDAMLKLVEAAEADESLPRLRAGIAAGQAVSRVGDWFGSPVNLASRVTGVARPGAVLVAESVRVALAESGDFRWSFAGKRHLKGISGEVNLYRARHAPAA
ncbi:adenylate/guanylate cyclase domain-containing protein [Mycolicibacter sp. MYC123]|uniref:Adenylate/guanylate cyclase domain-containing protein n=1 Tax=[Mycobacterium] zoologicum TaxID=2872311 RepID=A0ABU5YSJ6_9MYCO|nr:MULTISPECIES: adenylate/guanylate cyclase domain-containing protein [unclassified Mycolicibacter]MEB3051683.1 adenylate/guanylate cyclase domain-containing protein [Mycolicibacter sp. MYC123]MEB3061194.1 adenylate/guanylate cyclase domain-containing protein [Mycolicibacter sp. MYC101]